MNQSLDEAKLVRAAAAGDDSAFEALMLAHEKQVYNLCLRMSGSREEAFDLSQESFVRAWRALGQYQFEAEFSTWLFRLASNVCIDFLRRQKRQSHVSLTLEDDDTDEGKEYAVPDPAPLPEQTVLERETKRELYAAMQALPAEYREILQLRVVESLPYDEIGKILGVPIGTVKSRLARARLQLRKNLLPGNQSVFGSSIMVEGGERV
jgi:RNA polymerase sigma factor (sigma-70 family)